jgi:hypothetical protein
MAELIVGEAAEAEYAAAAGEAVSGHGDRDECRDPGRRGS